MPYADPVKRLEYKRSWNKNFYKKNKKAEKERILKRKKEIAQWFEKYKSQLLCHYCGEKTSICLDFHHIDDKEKDFNLALVKNWGWGKERIKKEVSKCLVLCSNCHRKVHAGLI